MDAYKGVMVADMKDMIGTLEALYMDALVDAGENYHASKQMGIVDDFVKEYKESHKGERYSSRETDAEGLILLIK